MTNVIEFQPALIITIILLAVGIYLIIKDIINWKQKTKRTVK